MLYALIAELYNKYHTHGKAVVRLAHKKLNRKKLLNLLGGILLILAAVLLIVGWLFQDPTFLEHYADLMTRLAEFEYAVAALPNKWLVIVAILLIYLSKSIIPLPISAVCVIAGIAFPTPYAILINITGMLLLLGVKYFWGKYLGGGIVHRFLTRNKDVERILNKADNKAKAGLLFAFRLVPSFPVNTISQVYGAMRFDFRQYLLFSLLGFMPKIVSYSFIGRNVFNPFSMAFILPFVILFTISGLSLFGINKLIEFYNNNFKNKDTPLEKS